VRGRPPKGQAFLVGLGPPDRDLEPVIPEAQVGDVEGDELGAAAAAREPQADQRPVPGVGRIVLAHRFDEGSQRVDEHGVFLVGRHAEGAANPLKHLGDLSVIPRGREAVQLVRLADGDQGTLDRRDLLLGDGERGQIESDRAG
jgi:hypothetical protein